MSVLVLEAGIIFHSILLGITLIVAGDSVFVTLFVVILFHQMFEGLALGARIADLDDHKSSPWRKTKTWVLPITFAIITPIGMAIGIGVLNMFNGNNPSTIIALGTLDAFSAGILCWVGLVSMWANDWLYGALREAPLVRTMIALLCLVCGMILMGVLGKWA
jgi:zinc transporter 1/2/3